MLDVLSMLLIGLLATPLVHSALDLTNHNSRDIWNWVEHGFGKNSNGHPGENPLALSIEPGLSTECLHHLQITVSMTTTPDPDPSDIRELCHHVDRCYICGILSLQMRNLFDTVLGCSDRQHYKRAPWGGAERRYDALLQVLGSKMSGKKRTQTGDVGNIWGRYGSNDMSSFSVGNNVGKNPPVADDTAKVVGPLNKRQIEAVGDGGIYPFADNTLGAFASDLALQTYAAMLKQDYRQIRGDNRNGRRTRPFVG